MKTTEKTIQKMYDYSKNYYEENWGSIYDMYELKRFYTDFAEEFDLDVAFWIDWCEYWGDEEIYAYIYVNNIWSIVFNWSVNCYTDGNFYKDPVNYILELENEWEKIRNKLEKLDN